MVPSPTLARSADSPGTSNRTLIRRLLSLAWCYRAGSLLVLAQQVLLVVLTMGGLGLVGLGIDFIRWKVQPGSTPPAWPFGLAPPANWPPLAVTAGIAGLILAVAALHAALRYAAAVSAGNLVQEIVTQLRSQVYDKLQRLSFRFFDGNESGSIINRVAGDVQSVRMFIDGVTIQVLSVLLSLAVYLAYMLRVHVGLTLACLATTPALWLGAVMFSKKVRPAYRRGSTLTDRMLLVLSDNIRGVQVVKGFARQNEETAKYAQANAEIRDQKEAIFHTVSMFQPIMGFLTQMNMMVLLGYGGYLVIQGEMRLGEGLFVFANLLSQFANQVSNITNIANSIQASLTGAERVFEVLDAPEEVVSKPEARRLPKARGAVRFERVSFGYQSDRNVLDDVELSARPGQRVAVVGATGSGKSTLLSLIPRFYDVSQGRVTIDGVDVRDLHLTDLRRNIGLVFQESFLFSNTVAANIAFGQPNATPEQIERAARIAAAHDFIADLPRGYETVVGEYGSNLSGGQRQRLAIARAVLLEPSILILDDPTAAVDAETEEEIFQALDRVMEGRTTFVSTHRPSMIRRADLVIALDRGRVVRIARPEELLPPRGHEHPGLMLPAANDAAAVVDSLMPSR